MFAWVMPSDALDRARLRDGFRELQLDFLHGLMFLFLVFWPVILLVWAIRRLLFRWKDRQG